MFRYLKTAIRFFALGVAAGVLIAPRAGQETRQLLKDKFDHFLADIGDLASLTRELAPDKEERPRPARPRRVSGESARGGRKRVSPASDAAG